MTIEAWRGAFGDAYIERNDTTPENLRSLARIWPKMIGGLRVKNILEVGANIGLNLRTIEKFSDAKLTGVEPNARARAMLAQVCTAIDAEAGLLPFADREFDLVFTSGVLIHIHPDDLAQACKEIVRVASKHVLCVEYFSAHPCEVNYRGNAGMLWTRDFGKFYLETCPTLKLRDYGFFWGAVEIDSMNWWLFDK